MTSRAILVQEDGGGGEKAEADYIAVLQPGLRNNCG